MKHKILAAFMACMLLFCSVPCAAFIDTEGSTYEEAVDVLCELGIIEGVTKDYFEPAGNLTRAQMVTIAVRLYGVQNLTPEAIFEDVPADHWAAGTVAAGYKMGFINGSFNGEGLYFEPNRAVTRAEAAVILCNVMSLSAGDSTMVFNSYNDDVPVWAESAVTTLYTLGVMQSVDGSIWNAKESLSKGDAALMLYGVMKK